MVSPKDTSDVTSAACRRLVLLPVDSGVLFPECQSSVVVGDESGLDALRSIEGEQVQLFGFCTYAEQGEGGFEIEVTGSSSDEDDDMQPLQQVGTMALLRSVEFSGGGIFGETATCSVVGVQRFRIIRMEAFDPFPVAQVELFNDELRTGGEDELKALAELETKTTAAAEEVLRLSSRLIEDDNDEDSQTVQDALARVRKFAAGGVGTGQTVMSPIGETIGWTLPELERLELQSFALADIHDIPEGDRYALLCDTSTKARLESTCRDFEHAVKELAAKVALSDAGKS